MVEISWHRLLSLIIGTGECVWGTLHFLSISVLFEFWARRIHLLRKKKQSEEYKSPDLEVEALHHLK